MVFYDRIKSFLWVCHNSFMTPERGGGGEGRDSCLNRIPSNVSFTDASTAHLWLNACKHSVSNFSGRGLMQGFKAHEIRPHATLAGMLPFYDYDAAGEPSAFEKKKDLV